MRYLFLILITSCMTQKQNCGPITDQGVDTIYDEYWIEVQNPKTKNKKKLILERDQWFKLNMDKDYCIDSLKIW